MLNIIPDPDTDAFYGLYAGGPSVILPPNQHDLAGLAKYLRDTKKGFADLTQEELDSFKFEE